MCTLIKFTLTAAVLTLPSRLVDGEVFASLFDMEVLAALESQLLEDLDDYIRTQHEKLRVLQAKLEQLKEMRPPELSVEEVISDPINAYTLVRRLAREWPLILNLMIHNLKTREHWNRLPVEQDLDSAVRGMYRLQTVYGMGSRELVHERRTSARLTALDCFELGKYSFKEQSDYRSAGFWFETALELIADGDKTLEEDTVIPHLFLASCYMEGNQSNITPHYLQRLLTEYPYHILDKESATLFRQVLSGQRLKNTEIKDSPESPGILDGIYNRACRGLSQRYSSEAKCFYVHHNNPRLLIAPFKMEEINIYPPLLLFHDVISGREIEDMKTSYTEVRENCEVEKDGETLKISARTCDVGWVYDEDSETAALLSRRVGDMTGLDMASSEANQVASYGLGGEFLLHFDTVSGYKLTNFSDGDRLATVMFYASDVEEGGYTVFPYIGKAVTPAKGSAVFWFNIDHEGFALAKMLHGGCPVVRGSKWVINKWIHERGQTSDMFCPADKKFPKIRYYVDGDKQMSRALFHFISFQRLGYNLL